MSESGEAKRHAPTERRLRQAAERGDIRRSADWPKAVLVAVALLAGLTMAGGFGTRMLQDGAGWLANAGTAPTAAAMGWARGMLLDFTPLLLLLLAVAIGGSFFSGGFVFSLGLLKPDFSKLLPAHGLGQLFSKTGLIETAKSVLKFVLIGGAGAIGLLGRRDDFSSLAAWPVPVTGAALALVLRILAMAAVAAFLLGAADLALQYWLHRQRLRMSDTEIRDEMKEAAGNPHVRSRQRMLARRLARARQMSRLPEAAVIVTNPTHFAAAIRYRRGTDRAPLLLAKGAGPQAAEIVARGRGLGVPVVEAPPLARALHRYVEPGEAIPVALYRACAEVLAYIWKMQRWRSEGGAKPRPPPVRDEDIEVARPGAGTN